MRFSQVQKLKFGNVAKGTRAAKPVVLPLVNTAGPYQSDPPEAAAQRAIDGHPERAEIRLGVRAITPGELATILERAAEYARARKAEIDDRNSIYSLAYNLNLCAIACVDIDPVDDAGNPIPFDPANAQPFFGTGDIDSAIREMLESAHLSPDTIQYLAAEQEAWQDEVSPLATKLSPEQLWKIIGEVASSSDASPFLKLRLGTLLQCMRLLVSQLLSAQMDSSHSPSEQSESSSNGPVAAPTKSSSSSRRSSSKRRRKGSK